MDRVKKEEDKCLFLTSYFVKKIEIRNQRLLANGA
jgi:hypothetical protein